MGDKPSLPPTHEPHPIDGTYQYYVRGQMGTGELRLTDYLVAMDELRAKLSSQDAGASAEQQLEIAFDAVKATREFLCRAMPGTGIEAPLEILMMAMTSVAQGKRPAMFSIPSTGNGRDNPRILLEAMVSACVDILMEDPRNNQERAARIVAKVLVRAGIKFRSRENVPAHEQIIQWRKRIRKARGTWEYERYHSDLAKMRAVKVPDPESAVARMLEGFLIETVTPAQFNGPATDQEA
jgi:hypothetical protein